ncbi:DUF362 domain-containing protein [Desulfitibacter alkalitolerans]|uniref:DUF362 domain-containing protein n=1 Tax=Desulfitibacter alkalitolerans TaxID=264641 RepID=UPI000687FC9A|nr:DUF362 domain-containing protein [Desulfitibacter alkalitolerans]
MNNRVFTYKCTGYDDTRIGPYIQQIIEDAFPNEAFNNKTVFVKPNLLTRRVPEQAVTTHPVLVKEVCSSFAKKGAKVIIGDSPGGPNSLSWLKSVYNSTGMYWAAKESGAELNYDLTPHNENVRIKNSHKELQVLKAVVDSDYLINLPKCKTHGLTVFTGGPKNLYGCIPGLIKAKYHLELADLDNFCELIITLNELLKPNLTIMDAIIGMEGEGPSSGTPKYLGYIIGSRNPYLVDAMAVQMIGLNPSDIPVLKLAHELGIFSLTDDSIINVGHTKKEVVPFRVPVATRYADFSDRFAKRIPKKLLGTIYKWLKPALVFSEEKCTSCRICIESCPAAALKLHNKRPKVNVKECIYCYCCQELCPKSAVSVKKPALARWLFKH